MTCEEAKLILEVSRPGDEAAADPQLAEALALAQTDPGLGAWFAREQQWDASLRHELKTLPAPPDLKAQILARPNIVPLPVSRPRSSVFNLYSPVVWAMAAAIVIFLGFAANSLWTRPRPAPSLADFARDMILASPQDAHHVDVLNSNFQQVRGWLAERHALADIALPPAIQNAPGLMGCRIMDWHGRPVSMLCFLMQGTQHVDLFVTRAGTISDAPAPGQPRFAMVNRQITAGWSDGRNVYLMTGPVPEEFLRHCLEPSATARLDWPVWFASAP